MGVEDVGDAGPPDHDAGLPVTGEQDAERAGFEMELGGRGPVRQRVEDHHHVELSGLQSVRSVATTADTSRPSGIEHRDVERQNRTIPLSRYSLLVLDKDVVDDHTESWAAHDIEVRSSELATNVTEVWPHGSPALGTPRLDTSGRGPAPRGGRCRDHGCDQRRRRASCRDRDRQFEPGGQGHPCAFTGRSRTGSTRGSLGALTTGMRRRLISGVWCLRRRLGPARISNISS